MRVIVVIVIYFVSRDMLSFFINDFILYIAIVKRVALIAVNALYKSPLLLRQYCSTSIKR